jgi:hypothetical protein
VKGRSIVAVALAAAIAPASAVAGPIADPAHPELSARVAALDSPRLAHASPAAQAVAVHLPPSGAGSLQHQGDRIVVEVRFGSGAGQSRSALEAAGARVLDINTQYQVASVAVAPEDFAKVSEVDGVRSVTEALAPMVGGVTVDPPAESFQTGACPMGNATSEGDARLHANTLRSALGINGAGQKVGVISDSFNRGGGAAADVAAGDLPGTGNPCGQTTPVQVVQEGPLTGSDEGRAMLQIVHDLAPGADLAFATGPATDAGMASNILALRSAGATVISDDLTYFDEPVFQKGPIDVAVDQVAAAGVPYFSDAANNNIVAGGKDVASWETPAFRSATCPATTPANYTCEDFDPGLGTDATYGISLAANARLRLSLQWAEPWNGVDTDLDLLLYDGSGNFLGAASNRNTGINGTQRPFELLGVNNGTTTAPIQIAIGRFTGTGGGSSTNTPRMKLTFLQNGPQASVPTEYTTSDPAGVDPIIGPTIFGHNGSENGSSVAATDEASLTSPEVYSSRGPVTHYFGPVTGTGAAAALATPQVLQKPDITATDCVTTTVSGFGTFCGTSAASPHAAAVAALILADDPSLSPADIRAIQAASASPVGAFGSNAVGAGLVNAALVGQRPRVQVAAPPLTNNRAPAITFSAQHLATFACAIDGGAPQPCVSPFAPSLADGDHAVAVTATDAFGHTGAGTASFRIDTVAPGVSLTAAPKFTRNKRPTFSFKSADPAASFACRFDAAAPGPCTGARSDRPATRLNDGRHTFGVVATDPAGNQSPATPAFTVDTRKPKLKLKGHPAKVSGSRRARFKFASNEKRVTFQCKLDRKRFKKCRRVKTFSVGSGRHVLRVRALDRAKNRSKTKTFRWTVL